jgi:uncharacterized membrane protein
VHKKTNLRCEAHSLPAVLSAFLFTASTRKPVRDSGLVWRDGLGNIPRDFFRRGFCMAGLNDLAGGGKLMVPSLGSAIGGSSNRDLMADARAALSGNWGKAILGYLLYLLLVMSFLFFVLSALVLAGVRTSASTDELWGRLQLIDPIFAVIHLLLSGAVTVGIMAFFLGIAEDGRARLDRLFLGFQRFWTSLGVYVLYGLLVALWSLLLVIPGIIAAYRYAMAFYVVADDEDCGPWEALGRSKEMMKGSKWKFFCLNLRFIGWAILALIPAGLGYLWLFPYMQTSYAKFYEDVK